ncbi:MAG: replication initiation protein [Eubacteriales bacterium]|nr:replication initiation protein [Eubacteriales bacterium]
MARKEEKNKQSNTLINPNDTLTRSNKLLTAKYSATLLENKLTAWAMKQGTMDDYGRPSFSITTSEIRHLIHVEGNGIYDSLRMAAKKMVGRTIYFEGDNNEFKYINMIHYAEFKNGVFTITFTPECRELLYNLKGNFTSLNLPMLFSLKTNAAYRLFELLSVKKYLIDEKNTPISVLFPLSVLKLELNCIDTEETKVRNELMKKNPDYDKIVNELATVKKFSNWIDFKHKVLSKAIKEINLRTDLFCDFEPVKVGRGGKVVSVNFIIQKNFGQTDIVYPENDDSIIIETQLLNEEPFTPTTSKKSSTTSKDTFTINSNMEDLTTEEMKRSQLIFQVIDIITGASISQKDAIALLKVANNDIEKIRAAYTLAKKQNHIKNLIGWMTDAIKNDYSEEIEVIEGSQEKAESWKTIHQSMKEHENDLALRTWNRIKCSDNFKNFEHYILAEEGFDIDLFETIYSPRERNEIYTQWVRQ